MKRLFTFLIILLLSVSLVAAILIGIGVAMPNEPYKAHQSSLGDVIITNCTIVDIQNNRIEANRQITVKGGIITAIDSMNISLARTGFEVIDAKGEFVMPSLWDMHVHTLSLSPQLHFPLLIANGVTHIRDMGDGDSWSSDIDNRCIRDKARWEKLAKKKNMLMPHIMEATSFHVEEVDGVNASNIAPKAKELVEKLKARKEPFVKVQLEKSDCPPEFFYEVQKCAKQVNIPVLGHLPPDVNIHTVCQNGFKSVEHAWALIPHCVKTKKLDGKDIKRKTYQLAHQDSTVAQEVFASMKRHGVYYVPTHVTSNRKEYLAFESGFNENPNNKYVEPIQLWLWKAVNWIHTSGYDATKDAPVLKQYYDRGLEITNLAHKHGVKILAGSDAIDRNVYYGISLHEELQELVKAGLTNAEALQTATSNPAEYYGLSHEYGSIAVGKKSSFVLLRNNPLEDIRNTQSISMVFCDDKHYNTNELEKMKEYVMQQAKSYGMSCKFLWNILKNGTHLDC
jgi:imidazolonepropionase-like amidohydrolase